MAKPYGSFLSILASLQLGTSELYSIWFLPSNIKMQRTEIGFLVYPAKCCPPLILALVPIPSSHGLMPPDTMKLGNSRSHIVIFINYCKQDSQAPVAHVAGRQKHGFGELTDFNAAATQLC